MVPPNAVAPKPMGPKTLRTRSNSHPAATSPKRAGPARVIRTPERRPMPAIPPKSAPPGQRPQRAPQPVHNRPPAPAMAQVTNPWADIGPSTPDRQQHSSSPWAPIGQPASLPALGHPQNGLGAPPPML